MAGCNNGPFRTPWHAQTLPSGNKIKVTAFNLVWGAEHDDHALGGDCFAVEFVTSYPNGDAKQREQEAIEVFELVRRASEQWGFREATVGAHPSLEQQGLYDLYWFQHQADGRWSYKVISSNGKWLQNSMSAPGTLL
jgi:hypothetical protein